MKRFAKPLLYYFVLSFLPSYGISQTAGFITPDTVCVSQPVNVTNISTASSYYWNFCVANINETVPVGVNLGNVGNQLSQPVFMDYIYYNGNYYGFINNHQPSALIRLNFGNSLLNTPTAENLGNFGGIIPPAYGTGGIQVIEDNGKFYVILVGGYVPSGSTPRIVKIDLGADPANPAPTATNWGNIGGSMSQPIDLHIFNEGGNWYGFTTNSENNTLTRFSFGNSFDNTPTGVNLGNVGGLLEYPTGVYAINDNGYWRVFVVNGGNNSRNSGNFSLVRLDFGSSLLNTPTAVSLGNPGNLLQHPRDITILQSCGQIIGLATNGHVSNNNITKLDFQNDLSSTPLAASLGNIGNLSFPTAISKLFRDGDNLYAFVSNVTNNTITRLQFPGCTNSSIPSSTSATPPPITYNAPGVYNINLTIDDGLPTQSSFCRQVVVVPEPVHTPLQTIVLPPGGFIKIGTSNPSSNYQWFPSGANADSITVQDEGLYIVETDGYGCSNTDSFRIVYATADFSFQQDPCTPLSITFKNEAPGSTVIDWDFGNGQHAPGNPTPTITFTDFDTYNVTLYITNALGDDESVTKSIVVQVQTDDLIVTGDSTICEGMELQLNAIGALRYCWTPAQSLSATDISNPVATPAATTTYYLNSLVVGNNIIINGDFTSGNTGFTSEYNYASVNVTEEQYFVGSNPRAWNGNFTGNCTGHGGSGNMLMVNGSPVVDVQVWTQTVSVLPNTNYAFSTWIQSLFSDNPAQLMFSINGVTIGNTITASLPVCNWKEFYAVWNSGDNTTALISIVNKNTIVWGNDFALDDISFAPVTVKMDSVVVTVEKPPVVKTNKDTVICAGSTVQLNASGAATYAWSPSEGLSFTNDYNPEATPVNTIEYIVTGTSLSGCEARDTVAVTVNQKPVVSISSDTTICMNTSVQLLAGGGATYSWQPAITLDNPAIFNPIASPQENTTYTVAITDANQCSDTAYVKVQIRAYPSFWVSGDTSICAGAGKVVLRAGGGDIYEWSPEYFLDDPFSPDPVASPDVDTRYSVKIGDSQCGYDTTLYLNITVDPAPPVLALKANDINCAVRTARLRATGADSYLWSPAGVLDNAIGSNPVATIDSTTTFTVKGTSSNGCYASDTVTVYVTTDGNPLFLLPNVFTPNRDGINDCFGIAKWGAVQLEQFSVFNRWGEMVFNTKEASRCWDGTYQGVLQPSGSFVYIIKARTFCGTIERKGIITLLR